jgi:hypothetical protein
MKTIKLMISIFIMASFSQKTIAGTQTTGLYLTSEDYINHKLSFETDGSNGNSIRLNGFFESGNVVVIYNGKKQVLSKNEVFGYRSNNQDYRYFNNKAYKILDIKDFYIYSSLKLIQQGKGLKRVEAYFYSSTVKSAVEPLSIKNLQNTYAENPKFKYMVEAEFSSDNALVQYDAAIKEYKLKYIFEQSAQNK